MNAFLGPLAVFATHLQWQLHGLVDRLSLASAALYVRTNRIGARA